MTWEVIQGDCVSVMRDMEAESFHAVVTSPPFWGLRDYKCEGQIGLEDTLQEYIEVISAVFAEVRRVLRKDGTCWLNMGDCWAGSWGAQGKRDTPSQLSRNSIRNHPKRVSHTGTIRDAGLKAKDLIGLPWRVAFALQADGWWLRDSIIWCLSPTTSLYARTKNSEGPMAIRDLIRLPPEEVELWTGERWSRVRGWSHRTSPAMRITLRSGERIISSPNHKWPLTTGSSAETQELQSGDVIANTVLPEPDRPSDLGIPEDLAWFAGLYLAEGSRSDDAIQISGHAGETSRHQRVDEIARRYGGSCVMHRGLGNSVTCVLHGAFLDAALRHFIAGKTALSKHLHPRAWRSTNETLKAFMDGYLAGDGAWDSKNNRWRLGFGNNPQWADSLRTLAARLDATLTIQATLSRFGRTRVFGAYRGEWRWTTTSHHNTKNRAEVIAIECISEREVWDIGIEDEPHLFALASGVLTHNSKPNPMPTSVQDRTTPSHEYMFLLSKAPRYYYDSFAIRDPAKANYTKMPDGWDTGDGAHGSYHRGGRERGRKTDKQRGHGRVHAGFNDRWGAMPKSEQMSMGANKRSVWTIATQGFPEAHFATFPEALVEPCILAGTSEYGVCVACGSPWKRNVSIDYGNPGNRTSNGPRSLDRREETAGFGARLERMTETTGWEPTCKHVDAPRRSAVVLDPFAGSGTTGVVAKRLGRDFVGAELNPDYVQMAQRRIDALPIPLDLGSAVRGVPA